jgi:hypothetical protein
VLIDTDKSAYALLVFAKDRCTTMVLKVSILMRQSGTWKYLTHGAWFWVLPGRVLAQQEKYVDHSATSKPLYIIYMQCLHCLRYYLKSANHFKKLSWHLFSGHANKYIALGAICSTSYLEISLYPRGRRQQSENISWPSPENRNLITEVITIPIDASFTT